MTNQCKKNITQFEQKYAGTYKTISCLYYYLHISRFITLHADDNTQILLSKHFKTYNQKYFMFKTSKSIIILQVDPILRVIYHYDLDQKRTTT